MKEIEVHLMNSNCFLNNYDKITQLRLNHLVAFLTIKSSLIDLLRLALTK